MCTFAHADLCGLAPIFQGERSRDGNREPTFSRKLRVVFEHVVTKSASLLPGGSDSDAIFVPIGEAEDTFGIAIHDFDQIGQNAFNLSRMQRKIRRSACELANALHHSVTVGRHLGSEFPQTIGKRLTRRSNDMSASQQSYLDGSESGHGSTAVHHEGLAGSQRQKIDAARCRLDCHRQRGRLRGVQSLRDRKKDAEGTAYSAAPPVGWPM